MKYKRVLLKLSGEVLAGGKKQGIDFEYVSKLANEIAEIKKTGVQIAIVIGGGNFWRYRDFQSSDIERVNSDYMGMMATVMNSIAFASSLKKNGLKSRVFSALHFPLVVENYSVRQVKNYLNKDYVVICAGGTGNPFFTTDTAAALRASELRCELLLKATNVDYVYDKDPKTNPDAKLFKNLTYQQVLEDQLKVMDLSSIAMCNDSKIPVAVFNLNKSGNILKVLKGKSVGTIIS
ncbi:UMP kinase [Candidatus Peregrinibacteria bacterium]|nr:UMP kinase [Candidatus Peregrinibacteria bacterium]